MISDVLSFLGDRFGLFWDFYLLHLSDINAALGFVVAMAFHDAKYSKMLSYYHENVLLVDFDYCKIEDWRFSAKLIKGGAEIAGILFYGSLVFGLSYIIFKIMLFDPLLSFIRFNKLMPLQWYLNNHIIVRAYQWIQRRKQK